MSDIFKELMDNMNTAPPYGPALGLIANQAPHAAQATIAPRPPSILAAQAIVNQAIAHQAVAAYQTRIAQQATTNATPVATTPANLNVTVAAAPVTNPATCCPQPHPSKQKGQLKNESEFDQKLDGSWFADCRDCRSKQKAREARERVARIQVTTKHKGNEGMDGKKITKSRGKSIGKKASGRKDGSGAGSGSGMSTRSSNRLRGC